MIAIPNGWAQYDYQIGTFRAQVGDTLIGEFTGHIPTADALAALLLSTFGIEITDEDRQILEQERAEADGGVS
jgi:hypothetical protein